MSRLPRDQVHRLITFHINHEQISAADQCEDCEDWQLMPEIPSPVELMSPTPAYIPPNDIDQPYASKKEYLNIQYQLKRFEAVEPLRAAVHEYQAYGTATEAAFVFTQVFVKGYSFEFSTVSCRLGFSTESLPPDLDWNHCDCLKPDGLVLLSPASDNFKTICIPALVEHNPWDEVNRDLPREERSKRPRLVEILWTDPAHAVIDPCLELVMLEARTGYYEANRHVLVGLQHSALTTSQFDRYILQGDQIQEDITTVAPHLPESASALDESQNKAFQAMLSRELALVQGPPGTGKTFTSVVAIESLIETARTRHQPPVLVAAQTNHALDQLLEHCIKRLENGGNVVRLGSRSKSPIVANRTIRQLRTSHKLRGDNAASAQDRSLMKSLATCLETAFSDDLLNPDEILAKKFISEAQHESLLDDSWGDASGNSTATINPIAKWLGTNQAESSIRHNYEGGVETEDGEDQHGYAQEVNFETERDSFVPIEPAQLDYMVDETQAKRAKHLLKQQRDLYKIKLQQRPLIYGLFCRQSLQEKTNEFCRLLSEQMQAAKKKKIARWKNDLTVIDREGIQIIGCTTTGLSKYRGLIRAVAPKILLVEEAAESQEANITAALYPSLERVLLIGDHQQLMPSVDNFKLGHPPYHLNVSLFERLILNMQLRYAMLKVQRRMAPSICEVVQTFYPKLKNHQEVIQRTPVAGMGSCHLWWFQHEWPEQRDKKFSYSNRDEALMIIEFIKYLLQNGVRPKQITVLTYYNGQVDFIKARLKESNPDQELAVRTVDGFQGEENDVILLSLVRSSESTTAKVGFVEDENRAVVATSRARRGMYVFGNANTILQSSERSRKTWQKVVDVFETRKCKDAVLPLTCTRHNSKVLVQDLENWSDLSGGCRQSCEAGCPRGHPCALKCHPDPVPCRCTQAQCPASKEGQDAGTMLLPIRPKETTPGGNASGGNLALSSSQGPGLALLMQDYEGALAPKASTLPSKDQPTSSRSYELIDLHGGEGSLLDETSWASLI